MGLHVYLGSFLVLLCADIVAYSPVYTSDKVEFNTVDFVESRQSRPCGFDTLVTKLTATSCRIYVVADLLPKPATKSTVLATKSTVSATVDFVADLLQVSATVDFQRLTGSTSKTMLKPRLAAAANTYTSDFSDVQFSAAWLIG